MVIQTHTYVTKHINDMKSRTPYQPKTLELMEQNTWATQHDIVYERVNFSAKRRKKNQKNTHLSVYTNGRSRQKTLYLFIGANAYVTDDKRISLKIRVSLLENMFRFSYENILTRLHNSWRYLSHPVIVFTTNTLKIPSNLPNTVTHCYGAMSCDGEYVNSYFDSFESATHSR